MHIAQTNIYLDDPIFRKSDTYTNRHLGKQTLIQIDT
jgi:hypothetical protein